MPGRSIPLSVPRRLMCDYLALCRGIPLIPMQRTMQLAELVAARNWLGDNRPSWVAIFLKAYGQVCSRHPELRTTFMPRPWGHLYEHPEPVAVLAVERQMNGENAVLPAQMRDPGSRSLNEINAYVQRCKEAPLDEIRGYRRALRLSRYPWIARAMLYELSRWCGAQRSVYLGTFGIGVTASHGASTLAVVAPLTTTLHYGEFAADGSLPMRLTFDHRVIDGAFVARVLTEFEEVLLTDILSEVRAARQVA